ncbi:choice-of-anchor D domain-containing protein [Lujinxingia litoralis]|nr:choice-of-anchor D domain-containing protein [Lujinxingia litoralis]
MQSLWYMGKGWTGAQLVLVAAMMLGLLACGDRGIGGTGAGVIEVSPTQIGFAQVNLGDSETQFLTISNRSDEELQLFEVTLEAVEGGTTAGLSLGALPELPYTIGPQQDAVVEVTYTPDGQGAASGRVRILSSDPRYSEESPLYVNVSTLGNTPELLVDPPIVRFARATPGAFERREVRLINIGTAPLTIYEEPVYGGGEDFSIEIPERAYPLTLQPFDSEQSLEEPERYELVIGILYQPTGQGGDTGEIAIETDDVRDPHPVREGRGLTRIDVLANADAPCIEVDSRNRNLGQVPIGSVARDRVRVTNCGTKTLSLENILLDQQGDSFELDLGSWDSNGDGQMDRAVSVARDTTVEFGVRYVPLVEGTERAQIVIVNDDPIQPELPVDLVARGADGECPVASALGRVRGVSGTGRPSLSAIPLQYVILDGSQSSDPDGAVVDYEWEVLQGPPGTLVQLGPTQDDPLDTDGSRREFRLLTAGTYRIGLNVIDNDGFRSCEQAVVEITSVPDQDIHIELTWTNPEDPDEGDSEGSDVDLHLTKMGPGRWAEEPYSIYFQYPNRSEEPIWNPEDPSLDIDVRDGAGPENITMRTPSGCEWYAVGVHYYRQLFGTAYATVRIYIQGSLRYESTLQPLERTGEFWDVARIHWSAEGQATIVETNALYPALPEGQAPEVTNAMVDEAAALGLCSTQQLY